MSIMIAKTCSECGELLNSVPIVTEIDDKHSKLDYKFVCNKCGYEEYEDVTANVTTTNSSCLDEDYDWEDWEDDYIDDYETKSMKFIWGVKSWDDLTGADACLYTMNDIELIYLEDKNKYILSVETIYSFEKEEYKLDYLERCLDAFTKFMEENGYNTNEKPFWMDVFSFHINSEFDSIEDCYAMFKLLVNGYCSQGA